LRHFRQSPLRGAFKESGCLGMQPKMGGKFHLKLNIGTRPIAHKYCEGKMKSTLKRELKARETVKREPIEASKCLGRNQPSTESARMHAQRKRRVFAVGSGDGALAPCSESAWVVLAGEGCWEGNRSPRCYSPASPRPGATEDPHGDSARLWAGLACGMRLVPITDYM
jgi:hypothetical protein